MEQVTVLPVAKHALLNPAHLQYLSAQLGPEIADNVVCRALEELALRLSAVERDVITRTGEDPGKNCNMVMTMSDQLGLTTLCRVAQDVAQCAQQEDRVALMATTARLIRTGEASMTAIWNHQDQTF